MKILRIHRSLRMALIGLFCLGLSPAHGRDAPGSPGDAASSGWTKQIRETLLLVQRCNQSGDYTPLYNQLTPTLRQKTTPAQIGQALAGFRNNKIDLSPVSRLVPSFAGDSRQDSRGVKHLAGSFPTKPLSVRFMIDYNKSGQSWQISNFNLDTTRPASQSAQPAHGAVGKQPRTNALKPLAPKPRESENSNPLVQASRQPIPENRSIPVTPNPVYPPEAVESARTPSVNPHHRHVPPTTTNW